MSKISILVPVYQPPTHFGATPNAYGNKVVSGFERDLCQRAANVTKHKLGEKLKMEASVIIPSVFIEYRFTNPGNDKGLAEIIASALAHYGLQSVTVLRDNDAEQSEFDAGKVEELGTGLHDWSEG